MASRIRASVGDPIAEEEVPEYEVLTPEEAWDIFDQAARRLLHMRGEDFIRKWDAGEFPGDPEQPGVEEVGMLLSLVR